MAFFHKGDVVTVRQGLIPFKTYYMHRDPSDPRDPEGWIAVDGMKAYEGETLTISSAHSYGYHCKEDIQWWWTDEMFEEYIHRDDHCMKYEDFAPVSSADILSLLQKGNTI